MLRFLVNLVPCLASFLGAPVTAFNQSGAPVHSLDEVVVSTAPEHRLDEVMVSATPEHRLDEVMASATPEHSLDEIMASTAPEHRVDEVMASATPEHSLDEVMASATPDPGLDGVLSSTARVEGVERKKTGATELDMQRDGAKRRRVMASTTLLRDREGRSPTPLPIPDPIPDKGKAPATVMDFLNMPDQHAPGFQDVKKGLTYWVKRAPREVQLDFDVEALIEHNPKVPSHHDCKCREALREPLKIFDRKGNLLVAYYPGALSDSNPSKISIAEGVYEAALGMEALFPPRDKGENDGRHGKIAKNYPYDPKEPEILSDSGSSAIGSKDVGCRMKRKRDLKEQQKNLWLKNLEEKEKGSTSISGAYHFGVYQVQTPSKLSKLWINSTMSGSSKQKNANGQEQMAVGDFWGNVSVQRMFAMMGGLLGLADKQVAQRQFQAWRAMPLFARQVWAHLPTNRYFPYFIMVDNLPSLMHKDVNDARQGLCGLAGLGNFSCWLCLPGLGYKLPWLPGDVAFINSCVLEHQFTNVQPGRNGVCNRFTGVFVMHQRIFNQEFFYNK